MSKILIFGQGLAGSILALICMQMGIEFKVIDSDTNTSSKVAAGFFNSIVFKRLNKSWNLDKLFPYFEQFYLNAEQILQSEFYYRKNLLKVFTNEKEIDNWLIKSGSSSYSAHMNSKLIKKDQYSELYSDYDFGEVKTSGRLDTVNFMSSLKERLKMESRIKDEAFNFNELEIKEEQVTYKEFSFDHVIFCQGFQSIDNPYFDYLPFKLVKGEVLTIKSPGLNLDKMVNKDFFIIPLEQGLYKVGSTYDWDKIDSQPTKAAREKLTEKVRNLINVDFEIVDHKAGIRPATKDRRPFVGTHPKHKRIHIFNGLGSKGVMIAPYYGNQLIENIMNGSFLDEEVNIERYKNLYNE